MRRAVLVSIAVAALLCGCSSDDAKDGSGGSAGAGVSSSGGGGDSGPCYPYVEPDASKPCSSACDAEVAGASGSKYCTKTCGTEETIKDRCPTDHICDPVPTPEKRSICHFACTNPKHICPPKMSCDGTFCQADPSAVPSGCAPYLEGDPKVACKTPCVAVQSSPEGPKYCAVPCASGGSECPNLQDCVPGGANYCLPACGTYCPKEMACAAEPTTMAMYCFPEG